MKKITNLAFDFGASSGRLIMSNFDGNKIDLTEIYRFQNEPVNMGNSYYWDIFRLFYELKNGLKKVSAMGIKPDSMAIDTWGVDYGLLDKDGNLIGMPIHYRDKRTLNVKKEAEKILPFKELYKHTGIQFLEFNTVYQLLCDKMMRPQIIDNADALLFIPDLFNYYLTGKKYNEYTIASTSALINANTKKYDKDIIEKFLIPENIFQNVIYPGKIIGYLTKEIQKETGLDEIPVIAVGSHDTASAVAGTPLEGRNSAYLSCGTWSLLGIENNIPIINDKSFKYNFTNEGGIQDTVRILKNINGLWIIQQLKKSWSEHICKVSFSDIINAAKNAENKNFIINPNDKSFMAPLKMEEAIKEYCLKNGQGCPEGLGEIAIAAYNGLTHEYKNTLTILEKITGRTINTLNIVGGGIQDKFFCKMIHDKMGKKVVTGPVEASAMGNVVMQLIAFNEIKNITEGRKIIRQSMHSEIYE